MQSLSRTIVTKTMSRASKVTLAAASGFVASAGAMVVALEWAFSGSECTGDECALQLAAVMSWSLVIGALGAAVCGLVTYALTRRRELGD